ncbi:uncharacterized protein LY79DRAFT_582299 [Colletotrichum navitas]|uniref:Uncharacterized protein n=1 Tax=Colletotrichum navitas TaxID=681940 RepID=A0AAD8V2H9_9PEZI|nr:uncharacterized protein LY79DRAFT_582299 [Colletotrichum navitas]KAK1579759.1 hypothetical protein LY79DRAFT_582299 [Colletotrichum navitas]
MMDTNVLRRHFRQKRTLASKPCLLLRAEVIRTPAMTDRLRPRCSSGKRRRCRASYKDQLVRTARLVCADAAEGAGPGSFFLLRSGPLWPVAADFRELRMSMDPGNVSGIRVKHDCGTAGLLLAVARDARALVENHNERARA